jgi:ligand-binding sensor domain-containing protein/signal transduction histidine kinase
MQVYKFRLVLIILFTWTEVSAQVSNLKFEGVLTEKGASSGTIHCILKDNLGFIWLGTNNGLLRYDGYNFKEFKHDPSDSNTISGNQIWCIIQDNFGDLWIGTSGQGLNRYLYKEDRFVRYLHNPEDSKSLSSDLEVTWIIEDSKGNIWICLWEGGVAIYNRESDGFINFKHIPEESNTLKSAHRIYEDSKGFIWIGTSRGLSKFNTNKNEFTSYKNNPSDKYSIAGNYINSIIEDKKGNLWIGSHGGLSKYDYKEDRFINYKSKKFDPQSLSHNVVYSLCEDPLGNLWVGTDGGGLNYFDVESEIFIRYFSDLSGYNYLPASSIPYLLMDDNSTLWIGTVAAGVYKAVYFKNKFSRLSKIPNLKNSLSSNEVSAVLEDKKGIVWIGTYGGGLNKFDERSNKFTHYKSSESSNSLSSNFILSICEDDGNLWIGTENGLNFFEPQKNKFTRYYNSPDDTSSIAGNKITSIIKDKQGNLWLGSNGGGLCILSNEMNSFRTLAATKPYSGFGSNHVWALFEDNKNNIWCGTWGMGAIKYLYNEDKFIKINTSSLKKDSTYLIAVVSFAEDKFSNIWLGTWGNGLFKINPSTNEITGYAKLKGAPHENIYGILPDSSGDLWISTGNGLIKFNPLTKTWKTYDEEDGIQSLEFRRGAFHKGPSGRFYFGGVLGLNYFYPEKIVDNNNIPGVAFTSFKIFDREVPPSKFGSNINMLDEITLSYDENFISFEFSAMEFTNPKKNQYSYKLGGIDNDWIFSEGRRYVSYPDLKPGEYIFTVKASNNDGIWNNEGRSIKIIIKPPFYSTLWAYIAYILVFGLALFGIRKYELTKRKLKEEERVKAEKEEAELREAKLKAETAELKAKAVESEKEIEKQNIRYRIASDLHDEIGSNLSSISILSSLAKKKINENGELVRHLDEINSAAKASSESIRDIVWFINPASDQLSNLVIKMKETANLMLGGIKSEIASSEIDPEQKINPDLRRNIYLIYKEILNNIIRHSKATYVKISIQKPSDEIIICIADNGIGFNENQIKYGNGLKNLKYRAEEIKGELIINSQKDRGTTINLVIPKV